MLRNECWLAIPNREQNVQIANSTAQSNATETIGLQLQGGFAFENQDLKSLEMMFRVYLQKILPRPEKTRNSRGTTTKAGVGSLRPV